MPSDDTLLADELNRAIGLLSEVLSGSAIRYALIGGLATFLRSRPRYTEDIDLLIDVPQLALPRLLDVLAERGFTFDTGRVIQEYVRHHMTAIRYGTVQVDWLKPVLPLYARAMTTATEYPWDDRHTLRVASPEGLILTKMVAFRTRDQEDIETVLVANRDAIDLPLIRSEWAPFAATEPDRTAWLEAAIARCT